MKVKYLIPALLLFWACESDPIGDLGDIDTAFEVPTTLAIAEIPDEVEVFDELIETDVIEKDRKLVKTGFLEFQTSSLNRTVSEIRASATSLLGYLTSETENELDDRIVSNLEIRIPADQFDLFLAKISSGVDQFDTKRIEIQDVTEEFFDLNTRLKTKKAIEQRYLDVLDKADSVKDILAIEEQAGAMREEIELIEGRIKYLSNKTDYGTMNIICYEFTGASDALNNSFVNRLKAGLGNGVILISSLLIGLVNIWPLLLLGTTGFILYRYRLRKNKLAAS